MMHGGPTLALLLCGLVSANAAQLQHPSVASVTGSRPAATPVRDGEGDDTQGIAEAMILSATPDERQKMKRILNQKVKKYRLKRPIRGVSALGVASYRSGREFGNGIRKGFTGLYVGQYRAFKEAGVNYGKAGYEFAKEMGRGLGLLFRARILWGSLRIGLGIYRLGRGVSIGSYKFSQKMTMGFYRLFKHIGVGTYRGAVPLVPGCWRFIRAPHRVY